MIRSTWKTSMIYKAGFDALFETACRDGHIQEGNKARIKANLSEHAKITRGSYGIWETAYRYGLDYLEWLQGQSGFLGNDLSGLRAWLHDYKPRVKVAAPSLRLVAAE